MNTNINKLHLKNGGDVTRLFSKLKWNIIPLPSTAADVEQAGTTRHEELGQDCPKAGQLKTNKISIPSSSHTAEPQTTGKGKGPVYLLVLDVPLLSCWTRGFKSFPAFNLFLLVLRRRPLGGAECRKPRLGGRGFPSRIYSASISFFCCVCSSAISFICLKQ